MKKLLLMLFIVMAVSCGVTQSDMEQMNSTVIPKDVELKVLFDWNKVDETLRIVLMKDKKTGMEYFIIKGNKAVAITPRIGCGTPTK